MAKQKLQEKQNYKFRALKSYASQEWLAESKKKYRQVFDRSEVRNIYAEFSFYNKLFDETDWETNITLKAFYVKDSNPLELCVVENHKHVSKDHHTVFIREGCGNEQSESVWEEGTYYWEAYIGDKLVGKQYFYIYDVGMVNAEHNPYLIVDKVRLFEGGNQDSHKQNPVHYTEFYDKETRFIWIEFEALNRLDKDWIAELNFYFYNDARQLKGYTTELVKVKKSDNKLKVTSGWGSDYKGSWFADNYTVEVTFMDTLIAVVPFKVGPAFSEGETSVLKPGSKANFLGMPTPSPSEEQDLDDVIGELDNLIGLESVKARIKEYAQYLKFLKLRREKGFNDEGHLDLNIIFTGNPGTGKTTVARMLGKIYKQLGLLSRGHVSEVDRAELIGEYIGQTAPKVKAAIEKARGGILFIDEAYALARGGDDTKDYGREAIEILMKEMTSLQGDIAIIVAGYPREMDSFLQSNPGLRSRFNLEFHFPDYTPQELDQIASYWSEKRGVKLTPDVSSYLSQKLVEAYRNRDRSFGNARYVLKLVDEAKMNLGLRVMQNEKIEELTEDDLSTLSLTDVEQLFENSHQKKAKIPIDENLLRETIDELGAMVGLREIKDEISQLVSLVRFYKEIGKDVVHTFSLHTVFIGNPGTGKTTVARILGKIYKALGILERGIMVECDRQSLVAGYVGQTALKTNEIIDQAREGVLFIDEAYTLMQGGQNDFGREAIEVLLKRMEDMRGELVVIVAGYPKEMQRFLEMNPGLQSRFDRKFVFRDYETEELMSIALHLMKTEELEIDPDAQAHLKAYLKYLNKGKSAFFGNARAVRKIIEKIVKNQHLRMASVPKEDRNPEMLSKLTLEDVSEFKPGNDSLLEEGGSKKVGFH